MNTQFKNRLLLVLLFTLTSPLFLFAGWHSLGLTDQSINCLTMDDQGRLIAGTNNGIFVQFNDTWHKIDINIPANDIIITGPSRFVAALGGLSNSDGFYQADLTMLGPPFYTLTQIGLMEEPTALCKTDQSQLVYIANKTSIQYSIQDTTGSGFMSLHETTIPEYSFGVEMPFCSALHFYTGDKAVYAGGYDKSPEPGSSFLLRNASNNTFNKFEQLDISCITEGATDWGGVKLFIGTTDSGIYTTSAISSTPPQKFKDSPNNELVNDICVVPDMIGNICVAVESGVYTSSLLEWIELDNIPLSPNCLFLKKGPTDLNDNLYAGTNNDIYLFDSLTANIKQTNSQKHHIKNIFLSTSSNHIPQISFTSNNPECITIKLYNTLGKLLFSSSKTFYASGKHTVSLNYNKFSNNGFFFIQIKTDKYQQCKKIALTQ